ncbi:MAG TPA: LuxR C-terminal-related transcriptional regulator [Acidimicrobiales bacterium]
MASPWVLSDAGVSEREAEVLGLVAQGATNAEIAARLFVSVRTVESHVSSLLRKLGAADRRALARLVRDTGAGVRDGGGAGAAAPEASPAGSTATGRPHDGGGSARPGGGDDWSARPGGGDDYGAARPDAGDVPVPRALPVPLTSFVGRAGEVAELTAAVQAHRLVTATGPGGVGKTRLATAVAADLASTWRDGVWFVDLVPVSDEGQIATAVATTLGLDDASGRTVEQALLAHLSDRHALIVLDNCEHVLGGAAVLVEGLLGKCPEVTVLATSQARLMLPFEWVFAVPGLSLPGDGDEGDAIALFVERARQAGATVTDDQHARIGEICRRLDCGALAIELAAARLPSLGLDGLEAGLSERLQLLAGGSRLDERHQSLRSTIDWSYGLLDPADQALLRRISVFAAPFTAAAAAEVAGTAPVVPAGVADALARLVDHSLLVAVPGPETRYRALETIRQYGAEQKAGTPAGDEDGRAVTELDVVRRRHLRWASATLASLDAAADMPLPESITRTDEFVAARRRFDAAADDARAALKWAGADPALRPEAFALARLLADNCFTRGLLAETQQRYEQAATLAPDDAAEADMLLRAAGAAAIRHVGNEALRLWRQASDTASAAGDGATAAYALARAAELLTRGPGIIAEMPPEGTGEDLVAEARGLSGGDPRADAAILIAVAFMMAETDPEALATARRAVAAGQALGDPLIESAALDALSAIHLGLGDVPSALEAVTRRVELLGQVRPDVVAAFEINDAYNMAAEISLASGDFAAARGYADDVARLSFHTEEGHLAASKRLKVDALAGEIERVLADGERFRSSWERAGRPVATSLGGGAYAVAMAHGLRGDEEARDRWIEITHQLGVDTDRLQRCLTGYAPTFDAIVRLHRGDAEGAVRTLEQDPATFDTWYAGEWRPWYAALRAEAAVLAGHGEARRRVDQARPMGTANPAVTALVDRAAALADGDIDRLVDLAEVLARTGCRYQHARTLVLAGGEHAVEGRRLMAALGAAPMAEPETG